MFYEVQKSLIECVIPNTPSGALRRSIYLFEHGLS